MTGLLTACVGAEVDPRTLFALEKCWWAGDPEWAHPVDGGVITAVRDGTGGGLDLTPLGNDTYYRAHDADLNSQPALDTATDDSSLFSGVGITLSPPWSIVVIAHHDGTDGIVFNEIFSTTVLQATGGAWGWKVQGGSEVTGGSVAAGIHLFVGVGNGAASTLHVDDTLVATATNGPNNAPNNLGFIGGHRFGFIGLYDGDLQAAAHWPQFREWVRRFYAI